MEWLTVSTAVFVFLLTIALLTPAGQAADIRRRRIANATKQVKAEKYEELEHSLYERFYKPLVTNLLRRIAFLIPKSQRQDNKPMEKALRYAGVSLSVSEFTAIKLVVLLSVFALSFLTAVVCTRDGMIRLLIMAGGLLVGAMGPLLYLRSKARKRNTQIRNQLPEVMDILMVSVEAGLGLDEAISRMAGRINGPIVDEFQLVLREAQMGRPRKEAFARLSECADIQELKMFVSAVIQAEQMGIPIKNVLAVQASSMRDMRRQIAQEKGMKAPVRMIIPMVLFILPVLLIILLAPVVIQLIQEFS